MKNLRIWECNFFFISDWMSGTLCLLEIGRSVSNFILLMYHSTHFTCPEVQRSGNIFDLFWNALGRLSSMKLKGRNEWLLYLRRMAARWDRRSKEESEFRSRMYFGGWDSIFQKLCCFLKHDVNKTFYFMKKIFFTIFTCETKDCNSTFLV